MKPAEMTFLGLNQLLIFYSVGNVGREREREEEREDLREGAELEDLFNMAGFSHSKVPAALNTFSHLMNSPIGLKFS